MAPLDDMHSNPLARRYYFFQRPGPKTMMVVSTYGYIPRSPSTPQLKLPGTRALASAGTCPGLPGPPGWGVGQCAATSRSRECLFRPPTDILSYTNNPCPLTPTSCATMEADGGAHEVVLVSIVAADKPHQKLLCSRSVVAGSSA